MAQEVTVSTTIAAPLETVWRAFTTPADITGWNFATETWHCPSAEVDLQVGGVMKARMEARDGSMGFDFEGIYDEVAPLEAVAMTMPDGRKCRTTFVPSGGGVQVTTVSDAETENPIDMQRDGWQAILDNFAAYVRRLDR